MLATETATRYWATRHDTYGPGWGDHYWESWRAPHRQQIVHALERIGPWESLLELGCGPGANLRLIHGRWPGARLHGIDANREAVTQASPRLAALDAGDRITVTHGYLDRLQEWAGERVDVVLSCYALAYLDPGDLRRAFTRSLGLARVAVLIAEPMVIDQTEAEGLTHDEAPLEWRHDYLRLAQALAGIEWHATLDVVAPPMDHLNGLLLLRRR